MDGRRRTIEVDEEVADALEKRAAERGVSLDEFLTQVGGVEEEGMVELSPEELAELEARVAEWERDRLGVPAEEVFQWMKSWGTSDELPPPRPRRL
ncbi:MAG: hypothetical protein DI565_07845 [Ancylobacter novellus]|uniref:Uncharacterized protein n=1 Tax=Ancylobacter novellus TaxID=921 RepID=A0A2W5KLH6_ANCNO|nr:MAG: hypothetical protein DI565_07845 [Ancylobacter novellus]